MFYFCCQLFICSSGNTVVPATLWRDLEVHVPLNILPSNTSLSQVMTNWIDTAGYPLVSVSLNGNSILLTQVSYNYNYFMLQILVKALLGLF